MREQPGEGVGHVHSLLIKMIFRSSGNIDGDEDTEDGNCYLEDLTWWWAARSSTLMLAVYADMRGGMGEFTV